LQSQLNHFLAEYINYMNSF